jgi:hypothetical protein
LTGETIFESGPGPRNWIVAESVDGNGMTVAAGVGGRFRVGMDNRVAVGPSSVVAIGVGLASGSVGEASSKVGKLVAVAGIGVGGVLGTGVSGMRTRVGNCVTVAGAQAVKQNSIQRVIKERWNITRL